MFKNLDKKFELLKCLEKDDMIEYVRKDGTKDAYILSSDPKESDIEPEIFTEKQGYFGIYPAYNKAMYVYKRSPNGDLMRFVIHEGG